jgi:hypothetical protein
VNRRASACGAALLLLAGCAMPPPASVTMPATATSRGAGDETRGAIVATAYVFGHPASVAGNPAAAAEALGQLEFLAVELMNGPRWQTGFDPMVGPMLEQGRADARAAMGVRPGVAPQGAVDAWYAAAAALRRGDRARAEAALAPLVADLPATMGRLDALPFIPAAARATVSAQTALIGRDSDWGLD